MDENENMSTIEISDSASHRGHSTPKMILAVPAAALLLMGIVATMSSPSSSEATPHAPTALRAATNLANQANLPCVDCPEYVQLSAKDKLDRMWKKIEASEYDEYPNDWVDIVKANVVLTKTWLNETISETFDRFSDEYARDHLKVIHTHGSVAKVAFKSLPGHPYTGLFKGAEHGVIRFSLVKSPTEPCKGVPFTPGCVAPGLAVKFLRDGTYSNNIIAQNALGDGQGQDYNFFKTSFKTWVPAPKGAAASVVTKLFSMAALEPSHLGTREFAAPSASADLQSSSIKSPTNVYFVPPKSLSKRFSSEKHEFRQDFAEIESGTVLYDVWTPGKDGCLCDNEPCQDIIACKGSQKIGTIVTTSRFVASEWGDNSIFFQHERFKRKDRHLCAMAKAMPSDDVYRMSGNPKVRCVPADIKCTSGQNTKDTSFFSVRRRRVTGTQGTKCPFT